MAAGNQRGARARRPGRPSTTLLTRTLIAETALRVAGQEGFAAVTMQRLARELDVTPRALYNHVRDRQEVIDLTAGVMLGELPMPTFDAEDWRDALREAYREAREVYRQHPRALLISLDETITPGEVPLARFALTE